MTKDYPKHWEPMSPIGKQARAIVLALLPMICILFIVMIVIFADAIDQAPWWVQCCLWFVPAFVVSIWFVVRRYREL